MAKSSEAGDTMAPPVEACSAVKAKTVTSSHRHEQDLHDAALLLSDRGYRLGPKLGKGSYAKVRVTERQRDHKLLAVKIIDRAKAAADYVNKFLPRELAICLRLNHRHIMGVQEIIQTRTLVCVVMELAERGDLLEHIKRNGAIPDFDSKRMFKQISEAVGYLHDRKLCHRDLKCENVLIRRDRTIILTDFGFARALRTDQDLSKTFCGSAAYASPELLRGKAYRPRLNDVWGLGCILFVMVTGCMPFHDSNVKKTLQRQLSGRVFFPPNVVDVIPATCKSLIHSMLEPKTTLRLDIHGVLGSRWLCSGY
ncbi:testis-specific serine/threonine-protein kinase 6-like [Babylonia areolata]|uniref:testis-specific serine/threonine-protein kinase 6-like n=1 Tax=Babylonia areolata TaxID=304850 RepID=UPI003FD1F584